MYLCDIYLRYICGITQVYLKYISGRSQTYHRYIFVTFQTYIGYTPRNISGIIKPILKFVSDIKYYQAYLRNI